jgi:hypothetical protein
MSQVPHEAIPLTNQIRNHWIVALSALLALMATVAVVLVLAIDGGSTPASAPVAQGSQPAARSYGGPDESAVAAAVGSRPTTLRPDESKIAASIGSASEPAPLAGRPDESKVAAAIGSASESAPPASRPDESTVAASIAAP